MIVYQETLDGIDAERLGGFFVGWPEPPSAATHLRLLEGSSVFVLAVEEQTGQVVGFITALSDGVLSASIPLLEVRESHRGRGIGRELVKRVIAGLQPLYMIDLSCDADLKGFYEAFGFQAGTAMLLRDYDAQSGT